MMEDLFAITLIFSYLHRFMTGLKLYANNTLNLNLPGLDKFFVLNVLYIRLCQINSSIL